MSQILFDLVPFIREQKVFSEKTFGPGLRNEGIRKHIQLELEEIKRNPQDLYEWLDVVILALDGAWRAGYSAEEIAAGLRWKQAKNLRRKWPDWRSVPPNTPIEHVRDTHKEINVPPVPCDTESGLSGIA